ncbi:transglycosylase SLT domain-containing protein [Roseobacteraceae bacterium S113]
MTRALFCALMLSVALPAAAQTLVETSPRPIARATGVSDADPAPAADPPQVQADESTAPEAGARTTPLAELRPEARNPRLFRPLALAHAAMRAGDWEAAFARAAGDGAIALDVMRWHALREGRGSAADAMAFLARNSDWPGLPYLKAQMEPAMITAPDADILRFFEGHVPRTGTGALALSRALRARGQAAQADAVMVRAWQSLALEEVEQEVILETHGAVVAPHHEARLDDALWNGRRVNAGRMERLVSADHWALAQARMAVRAGRAPGTVPAALENHPGLAYEAFRAAKGASKRALLLERSTSAEALGRPELWAGARRPMARKLMRNGDLELAYRVASNHFITEGSDYADLEWLSGYLSLRLNKPSRALKHFEAFREVVFTPISLGRAGYWLGRAHEALGDAGAAEAAYRAGAQYQTSFYGLLAAEAVGVPLRADLRGDLPEGDWRSAPFTGASVHKAAVLLLASGEDWPAERFWTHLAETQTPEGIALMGKMLAEIGEPHIQVMLGKRAAQAGLEIAAPYYALHPVGEQRWAVPTELVLAIARRESEFDPGVVSGAGARGLMQLMPATARDVSRDLGLDYAQDRLFDPAFNARLGSEYLRQMSARYGGNPVLISIAYNAGPGRADRWQELYGDPRGSRVDIVDWIEGIPFRETRNYVMRVSESLPVYRARLGQNPLPERFSDMLKGSSLRPRAVEGE